jgi:hypothetical protein
MKLVKEITFAAKPGIRAEIKMNSGGLLITGNDEKEAQIVIEMESVSNLKEGVEVTDFVEFNFDETNNQVKISQTDKKLPALISNLKFSIVLPREADVSSRSTNGGIKVQNIIGTQDHKLVNGACKFVSNEGRLEAHSTNGAIKVIEHNGDIDLSQMNGAIAILDSAGKMQISNSNGVVKLNHCKGVLDLQHKNGGIKILQSGFTEANVETSNSSIYYEFENVEAGKFSFINSHGRTNIIIPNDLQYNIHAKNVHGKINIGLDKSYETKGDGEKEYTITNGSASVEIEVENRHGSINILDELHRKEKPEGWISHKIEMLLKDKVIPTIETLTAENAPKVQKQIRKAGEKLSKLEIDIPDIELKIKKALNQVSESINTNFGENSEDIEKMKDSAINKVNKAWDNISGSWKETHDKAKEDKAETIQDRSRMKILELLEKEKISPDEAERLLRALGNKE